MRLRVNRTAPTRHRSGTRHKLRRTGLRKARPAAGLFCVRQNVIRLIGQRVCRGIGEDVDSDDDQNERQDMVCVTADH